MTIKPKKYIEVKYKLFKHKWFFWANLQAKIFNALTTIEVFRAITILSLTLSGGTLRRFQNILSDFWVFTHFALMVDFSCVTLI